MQATPLPATTRDPKEFTEDWISTLEMENRLPCRPAGRPDRVKKTMLCCLSIVTVIGLAMGLAARAFGVQLMGLYNSEPEVISNGLIRMGIIMPTYFICGLMDVMVGQLRGIGYSVMPMIVSLTGACLLRIVWILTVFAQNHTLTILYLSYPVSWSVTFVFHMLCYLFVARKRLSRLEKDTAQTA